jgi:hypothetical protein
VQQRQLQAHTMRAAAALKVKTAFWVYCGTCRKITVLLEQIFILRARTPSKAVFFWAR